MSDTLTVGDIFADPILRFFVSERYPPDMRIIVMPYERLAKVIAEDVQQNPERTVALRKLLESMDACLRAKFR